MKSAATVAEGSMVPEASEVEVEPSGEGVSVDGVAVGSTGGGTEVALAVGSLLAGSDAEAGEASAGAEGVANRLKYSADGSAFDCPALVAGDGVVGAAYWLRYVDAGSIVAGAETLESFGLLALGSVGAPALAVLSVGEVEEKPIGQATNGDGPVG
jgi:hypothetical protein